MHSESELKCFFLKMTESVKWLRNPKEHSKDDRSETWHAQASSAVRGLYKWSSHSSLIQNPPPCIICRQMSILLSHWLENSLLALLSDAEYETKDYRARLNSASYFVFLLKSSIYNTYKLRGILALLEWLWCTRLVLLNCKDLGLNLHLALKITG